MSFLSRNFTSLTPYVPGEQPKSTKKIIKLNTNESPYPPVDEVSKSVAEKALYLNLYSDPECTLLRNELAKALGVSPGNVLPVNGSDEILYFAFMAFCDDDHPIAFPDISYGFYPIFAKVNRIPAHIIPLKNDFSINYKDYCGLNENIVIANPNAPTGLMLTLDEIEEIVKTNPNNVVIIDEAYVDFGGTSAVPLTKKYKNLLVTQTFSKSRSMAGARLGMGIGSEELICDLNTIRNSFNPYNVNAMTQAAGIITLNNGDYYTENCKKIIEAREYTYSELLKLGYKVLPSFANFLFVGKENINGETFYRYMKEHDIIVRYLPGPRTSDYVRVSIGTLEEMQTFIQCAAEMTKEI